MEGVLCTVATENYWHEFQQHIMRNGDLEDFISEFLNKSINIDNRSHHIRIQDMPSYLFLDVAPLQYAI